MSIFELFKKIETPKPTGQVEWIVAGLGNPGPDYEKTRHNAGFMAIDRLAETCKERVDRAKWKGLTADVNLGGKRVLLVKPQTYMNNSGACLREITDFYHIPPEKVLVLFDDISLEPGHLRIRRKGSAGGHNGIKSIIEHLGSDAFPRVKIGVGKKPHPDYDLAEWVLSSFTDKEKKELDEALNTIVKAVELIVGDQIAEAMNSCNS